MDSGAIEIRAAAELRASGGNTLDGYAAVFNTVSRDLGGFTEEIHPGAFSRSLASAEQVMALYDHDRRSVLGRVGAETLKLAQDTRGLHFTIDLPDTQVGRDLSVLVKRGDIAGASFAFTTPRGGDSWSERSGIPHRTLMDVDLHEITVCGDPAYPDTSVATRSLRFKHWPRLSLAKRVLETC